MCVCVCAGGGGGGGGARREIRPVRSQQAGARLGNRRGGVQMKWQPGVRTWPSPEGPIPVPVKALRSTRVTPAPVAAVTTPCSSSGMKTTDASAAAGQDGTSLSARC